MGFVGHAWRSGQATDPEVNTGAASTATVSGVAPTNFVRDRSITLTVTGTGFTAASVLYASYSPIATTFDSATQLRCTSFNTTPDSGVDGTIPIGVVKPGEKISGTVNFTAGAAGGSTAPAQVTGLTVGTVTSTTVALTWTTPANGGSTITDYLVEYSSNGGTSYNTFIHAPSPTTSITVSGLVTLTAYLFRVSAINAVGTGTASATASTTTLAVVPAQVTGLSTGAYTDTTVALSWTAPANGGSAITDYKVEWSLNGANSWTIFSHSASTATSRTVTGLTPGTGYDFRVSALNGIGYGPVSSIASWQTDQVPDQPFSLTASQTGINTVSLSWGPAGGAGTAASGYKIERAPDASGSPGTWTTIVPNTGNTSTAYVDTVSPGSYWYQVSGINVVGTGPASTPFGAVGVVPPVTTVSSAGQSNNSTTTGLITFQNPPALDGDLQVVVWGMQSTTEAADITNNQSMTRVAPPFVANDTVTRIHSAWILSVPSKASMPSTVQFSNTSASRKVAINILVRNANIYAASDALIVNTSSGSYASTGTTARTISALTPTINGRAYASFSATFASPNDHAVATAPAGWTLVNSYLEPVGGTTSVSRNIVYIYEKAAVSGVSTGTCTLTYVGTPAQATGFMFVIRGFF